MQDVDTIVIGAGGAGVAAAAAAAEAGARVLIVSKEPLGSGDTRIAEGGVAFPGRLEGDSPELFAQDMFVSGDGLARPELVLTMARDGWQALGEYERWGAMFGRDNDGKLTAMAARRGAGHSAARSFYASGGGIALGSALKGWALRAGVPALTGVVALRVMAPGGEVSGVQVLDVAQGEVITIPCRAVVLATGSAGWLYHPHTDGVQACAGDGYAMALGAGAGLVEMEQVQCLPFACVQPRSMVGVFFGDPAFAGPYGELKDVSGTILLTEVARRTRAEVVKAMALAMSQPSHTGPGGGVFIDLSPNWEHPEGIRFMEALLARGGLDTVRKAYGPEAGKGRVPVEVLPTVHFNMGGVLADAEGTSDVPGLYAAGAALGGLHGGNRLGSTALAEVLVFGRRAGAAAARWSLSRRQALQASGHNGSPTLPPGSRELEDQIRSMVGRTGDARPIDVIRELQRLMWAHVGIARTEAGLETAVDGIRRLAATPLRVGKQRRYNVEWRDAVQAGLMLTTGLCMALAARARRESRGAHVRLDFPGKEPVPMHTMVRERNGALTVSHEPVPPMPRPSISSPATRGT